ncbi:hypothetical protein NC651_021984 [Populus alba x Populus x berolinensis]|nr:hypothetical protein NC651_021984 [Populus alba x Populus x berolinensis]
MGALCSSCMFLEVNNASTEQPIVSIERTLFYREKAAMYSPLSYALAQDGGSGSPTSALLRGLCGVLSLLDDYMMWNQ